MPNRILTQIKNDKTLLVVVIITLPMLIITIFALFTDENPPKEEIKNVSSHAIKRAISTQPMSPSEPENPSEETDSVEVDSQDEDYAKLLATKPMSVTLPPTNISNNPLPPIPDPSVIQNPPPPTHY